MDWFVLGIEPTKDKKIITNAYRQKLRQTNPEDKPQEFQALRAAYEEAMALADREEAETVRDESPLGLWMEAVEKTYGDYPSRIDPDCWKALMESDVCVGLDTRSGAEEALLRFLMQNYHLPKAVWQVLDETFHFQDRVEELYETWPRDFIDHAVVAGIRLDPSLDYALFHPGISGEACDAYRRLYHQANQTPLEELGAILQQMEELPESHPYGEALRYRFWMETDRKQEGVEGFRRLAADYPDDAVLTVAWANLCMDGGNLEEAQQLAHRILEQDPKHLGAMVVCAKCLGEKQQYHEAKEYAYEIIHACGDSPALLDQMTRLVTQWNEELIHLRRERYTEAPEDLDNAIELAWCYAQNERIEEAREVADRIDPDCEDVFGYHNLMAKLFLHTEEAGEALLHLQAAEAALRGMTDDGTDKTRKRMARLPEMLQLQGSCLTQLGRQEEAKEKFRQALDLAPEDQESLLMMGRILFSSRDYGYAVEIFRRLLRLAPNQWVAELLMALCLYRMKRDREAFEAVNRALAMQGSDLGLYVIKMQILIRNGAFEEVHEILDFLKETGAPEDIALDFLRAELTEREEKNADEARKQYQALQNRVEAGEDMIWTAELYYHLAVLTGNQLNLSRKENRETVLKIVDKGLDFYDTDPDLLAYKAWVLKKGGLWEEAVAMYRALEAKNPESDVALRGLADLYFEDLDRHAGQALACYEKLLERQKTPELYFCAATCKRQMGDLEGARHCYLKELEMDPEDIDGYRGLAFVCDAQGNYSESLELLDQALAVMEEFGQCYDALVEHKAKILRRMGRYEEALAFAEQAAARYQFDGALQLRFDICCQFGLWDRAKQVLDQWKRENRNDPSLMAAGGRLNLLQGKLFKAVLAMGAAKQKLPFEQVQDFRLQLADLECNHERQIQIWSRRVKQDPGDDHAITNLAHAYWHVGQLQAARGAAGRALALLDEKLSQTLTDEALYRSRRCLVLAILGRTQEAGEELEKTRKLPLCSFCEYGSCKDADIYEAAIQEILGNTDRSWELYTAGRNNWPDDLDFAAGAARLKKKGRK